MMAVRSGMLRRVMLSARLEFSPAMLQELGAHVGKAGAGKALRDAVVQRPMVSMTLSGASDR